VTHHSNALQVLGRELVPAVVHPNSDQAVLQVLRRSPEGRAELVELTGPLPWNGAPEVVGTQLPKVRSVCVCVCVCVCASVALAMLKHVRLQCVYA